MGRPGAAIGIYTDTRSKKRAHFISLSVSEHGDVRQFAPPPGGWVEIAACNASDRDPWSLTLGFPASLDCDTDVLAAAGPVGSPRGAAA